MSNAFLAFGIFGVICFILALIFVTWLYSKGAGEKGTIFLITLLLLGGSGLWYIGIHQGAGRPAKEHLASGTYEILHSFSDTAEPDVCYAVLERLERGRGYFFYAVPMCALKEIKCGAGKQLVYAKLAEKCGINLRPATILNPTMNR